MRQITTFWLESDGSIITDDHTEESSMLCLSYMKDEVKTVFHETRFCCPACKAVTFLEELEWSYPNNPFLRCESCGLKWILPYQKIWD